MITWEVAHTGCKQYGGSAGFSKAGDVFGPCQAARIESNE